MGRTILLVKRKRDLWRCHMCKLDHNNLTPYIRHHICPNGGGDLRCPGRQPICGSSWGLLRQRCQSVRRSNSWPPTWECSSIAIVCLLKRRADSERPSSTPDQNFIFNPSWTGSWSPSRGRAGFISRLPSPCYGPQHHSWTKTFWDTVTTSFSVTSPGVTLLWNTCKTPW